MNYHICLAHPQENPQFGLVFQDIALLLANSFHDLGLNCTLKINQPDENRINIILGTLSRNSISISAGTKYIPYQLEQLAEQQSAYQQPGMAEFLQNAAEVWDYAPDNIAFLRSKNIRAKHLPIGYHSALENCPPPQQKDIDILFYGQLNERRIKILKTLIDRGLKIKILDYADFAFGKRRAEYIARAKIILNIHYYDMKIFESARITYLFNNKALAVSEQSVDNPYPQVDLISAPYENLVEECIKHLADWENSRKIAELNYQQFKENYPMVKFLQGVIS